MLEEQKFEPVGGCRTITVNVRIIAATHRDLEEEVQKGNFREDLFYRLYVIPIKLPALRERITDLPYFVSHFIDKLNKKKEDRRRIDFRCSASIPNAAQLAWKCKRIGQLNGTSRRDQGGWPN